MAPSIEFTADRSLSSLKAIGLVSLTYKEKKGRTEVPGISNGDSHRAARESIQSNEASVSVSITVTTTMRLGAPIKVGTP